ncbi:MAG: acyl-CoA thioesterase domain-containing protein [Gammaproteobacteria bacterium]
MKLLDFLKGDPASDGSWTFNLGRELHGAFGGANGGVVGATCLAAARSVAEGRVPASLDVRFIRGLTEGEALVTPTVLHTGRTLSVVSVDILDSHEKLCTRATVSLADPGALEPLDYTAPVVPGGLADYEAGKPWAKPASGVEVPLIETFQPRLVGNTEAGLSTEIKVLWQEPGTCAEAACIVADISVGPPVGAYVRSKPIPIPNPDLTLRFCSNMDLPATVVSTCRLEGVFQGIASTHMTVHTGDTLLAVGVSTTTLLKGNWPDARKSKNQK